jgi:hypothetical protein
VGVGIDLDSEYAVWLYRPSPTATYALTAAGSIIEMQAGAREVVLGFNSAGAVLADLNLQCVYNSGGGAGTPFLFTGHTGASFLDEWVYYFILDNSTDGQIAGYIKLSDLNTAVSNTRANDNAGSQFTNSLLFGNEDGHTACVLGYYAYGRARYGTGITLANAKTYAASDATIAGDWGFWPLADNTDTGDDSGNARDLTFGGTLSNQSSPTLGSGGSITLMGAMCL